MVDRSSLVNRRSSVATSSSLLGLLNKDRAQEILVRQHVKTLGAWFYTWQSWQQRVLICHVMGLCSKQQLELLATSLEPILHMDFTTSIHLPLQALCLEGVAKFNIKRNITQRIARPEILAQVNSQDYLSSLPTTFQTGPRHGAQAHRSKRGSISVLRHHPIALNSPRFEGGTAKIRRSLRYSQVQKNQKPVYPVLPLLHPNHVTEGDKALQAPSRGDIAGLLLPQNFSCLPDFHLAAGQLRKARAIDLRGWKKLKAFNTHPFSTQMCKRRAEDFKWQLRQLSIWMGEWDEPQMSYLLNQLVKFCDKELLGYFVQCLYQQLQDQIGINFLPDNLLLKVFSHMTPKDHCRCSRVCKRWNRLANMPVLWKEHTHQLGVSERVEDVMEMIGTVAKYPINLHGEDKERGEGEHALQLVVSEGVGDITEMFGTGSKHSKHLHGEDTERGRRVDFLVDWKKSYRELRKALSGVKRQVIKRAVSSKEEQLLKRIESVASKANTSSTFTLQEMLQILRAKCADPLAHTTYDLVQMAPWSADTLRRLKREEKREEAKAKEAADAIVMAEVQELKDSKVSENLQGTRHSHGLAWDILQSLMPTLEPTMAEPHRGSLDQSEEQQEVLIPYRHHGLPTHRKLHSEGVWQQISNRKLINKMEVVTDVRPAVQHLPDIDGIQCLILAGGLLSGQVPKPGLPMSIPKVRKLEDLKCVVLCIQCDSKKIVLGTSERTIEIFDIRSGRPVSTLEGHKGSVQCLQFDDLKIVSGSWDTSCIVWDLVHHIPLKQLIGHVDKVSCLQFDEDILVTGSYDGSLRMWNTANWEVLTIIATAHEGEVTCLKFNNRVLASGGSDKVVRLWCVHSHHCLAVLSHKAELTALILSQQLLITCSLQGEIVFWNCNSYKPVMRRMLHKNVHIRQLVRTQSKFYGAGSNGAVFEFDLCAGTCSRTLQGHSETVTCLWLGEHKLVTAGADYTVLVWYFRKAVELMKQDEEAKKRLWTAPGYQHAFNKYRSEGSKLEMQQQQLEDHYIEIPIKTATTTTSKNIFKKLTT